MTQDDLEFLVLDVAELAAKTAQSTATLLERTSHLIGSESIRELRDTEQELQTRASSIHAIVSKFRPTQGR